MMDINFSTNSIQGIFSQLEQQLEGRLTRQGGGYKFKMEDEGVYGVFTGNEFSNSISFIRCNLAVKKQLTFRICHGEDFNSLYFIYCNKGKLLHLRGDKEFYHPIYENRTVVIKPGSDGIVFQFLNNSAQEFIVIKMNLTSYIRTCAGESATGDNLASLFRGLNRREKYIHYGSYNLKICDHLKEIDQLEHSGLLMEVYVEARIKLILGLLIKQCRRDLFQPDKEASLCSSELKRVKQVADYIAENYAQTHTLNKLTLKFRISPSKLQKGFKILYNRTVSNYIKNLRTEIAEDMLKHKECTISEIVYDIGFTSRSYFSKIFKEKYNCSPKDYQDLLKSNRYYVD